MSEDTANDLVDFDALSGGQKAAFRASPLGRELAATTELYRAQDVQRAAARSVASEEQMLARQQFKIDAKLAVLQRQRDELDEQMAAIRLEANAPLQEARARLAAADAALDAAQAALNAAQAALSETASS